MDDLFKKINEHLEAEAVDEPEGIEESVEVFTEEETNTIITSFLASRGEEGATEKEMQYVIDWCKQGRIAGELVDLILDGLTDIGMTNGELEFRATPKGIEVFKEYQNGLN